MEALSKMCGGCIMGDSHMLCHLQRKVELITWFTMKAELDTEFRFVLGGVKYCVLSCYFSALKHLSNLLS